MGLLQPETVAGTLQELKTTSHATLKISHVSRLRNPKYLTPTAWRSVAVSTNIEIADKKKCSSIAS